MSTTTKRNLTQHSETTPHKVQLGWLFLLAGSTLVFSLATNAEIKTYRVSGVVTELLNTDFSVDDPFNGSMTVGTEWSAIYQFDTSAMSAWPDACATLNDCGWYYDVPPYSFTAQLGSLQIVVPEDYLIRQAQDVHRYGDTYFVSSADYFDIGGNWTAAFSVNFYDSTGIKLDGKTTQIDADLLSGFDRAQMELNRWTAELTSSCSGCQGLLRGTIDTVEDISLPPPITCNTTEGPAFVIDWLLIDNARKYEYSLACELLVGQTSEAAIVIGATTVTGNVSARDCGSSSCSAQIESKQLSRAVSQTLKQSKTKLGSNESAFVSCGATVEALNKRLWRDNGSSVNTNCRTE